MFKGGFAGNILTLRSLKPIGLGLLSGALLALSLPKPDLYPLAWIALVPLLVLLAQVENYKQAAIASYSAGVVFFAGTFYWIAETMMVYGGLNVFESIAVGALFVVVFALYFLIFGSLIYRAVRCWGPAGILAAAPVWVSVELLRTYLISGFPWMLSGYALVPFTGLLQIAEWTGIYGLSFVAAAVNSGIALGVAARRKSWLAASIAMALVLSVFPLVGAESAPRGDSIEVRLVQTQHPLDQPWKDPEAARLMVELAVMSTQPGGARLLVWPETPAPFFLNEDEEFRRRIQNIARTAHAYILLGYVDQLGAGPSNSAALMDPSGKVISRYDKMHLVPFGEYVPLKRLLFFAQHLTQQVGSQPGTQYTISPVDHHQISTAICYESIFPDLVREFVKRGSELIVVITNDGWFGESSAPYQHLRMGVVRAVENRRYVVRTANTGISAIIDPYGRIENQTPIGRRVILDGVARFRSDLTFYTKYGDVFAYLNVVAVFLIAVFVFKGERNA